MRFPPEVASLLSLFRSSFAREHELAWKIHGPILKDGELLLKKSFRFPIFDFICVPLFTILSFFILVLVEKLIFTRVKNSSIFRQKFRVTFVTKFSIFSRGGKIKFKHFSSHSISIDVERSEKEWGGAHEWRGRNWGIATSFPQRLKREFTIPWRIELFGFLAVSLLKRGWERGT